MDAASLRLVRAIGDTGSISAAARALGYSQPAVSQQLRRLEQRLGTALVDRGARTTRLTEAGAVLARHAGSVLASLAAAEEEVAAVAGLRAGRVRLTAFPSSSATLVPRALRLLRDRHPAVQVTFTEAEPPESLTALREGHGDVAVSFGYDDVPQDDAAEGLHAVPLLTDRLLLALPADHRLADRAVVPLEALADETWVAGCPRCRRHLLRACERRGFAPAIAFATDDYVAVLGLVAAGLGVALVPELVLDRAVHAEVAVREVHPASRRAVAAVTTPDLRRVPAVAATLDALREAAAGR